MAFGQDFLKGFGPGEGLADYAHAAKTFLTNGYEFAPRSKFLFHVYFTINTAYVPLLASALDRKSTRLNSSHSQQSRMPSSA